MAGSFRKREKNPSRTERTADSRPLAPPSSKLATEPREDASTVTPSLTSPFDKAGFVALLRFFKRAAENPDAHTWGSGSGTGAESTTHPLILPTRSPPCFSIFSKIAPYLHAKKPGQQLNSNKNFKIRETLNSASRASLVIEDRNCEYRDCEYRDCEDRDCEDRDCERGQ
jgi:hypothetical protein